MDGRNAGKVPSYSMYIQILLNIRIRVNFRMAGREDAVLIHLMLILKMHNQQSVSCSKDVRSHQLLGPVL